MKYDLIIVGAGAAGLFAAARAAECGAKTLLLEKNNQPGIKILMSGGTRCNITHATDQQGIAAAFAKFDKKQAGFLRSSLAALPPEKVIQLIEAEGVLTKVEDTGKIFPVSNKAIDVREALHKRAVQHGAVVRLNSAVDGIRQDNYGFTLTSGGASFFCTRLLITSGGQSYPGCGTTGDGYTWASQFGHTIVNPVPALTPITTDEAWVRDLKGITLPDAVLAIVRLDAAKEQSGYGAKQFLTTRRSSLLFTHFGLSGPSALDISRVITRDANRGELRLVCDFLPHVGTEEFQHELTMVFQNAGRKQIASIIPEFVPKRLAEAALQQCGIAGETKAAEISKKQNRSLVTFFKACVIGISGTLGFKKAEVTAGGVALKEVDSKTLQSRLVPGLYFAGEVLDIDGPIGGFNFQAAFSTGWLAGQSAAAAMNDSLLQ